MVGPVCFLGTQSPISFILLHLYKAIKGRSTFIIKLYQPQQIDYLNTNYCMIRMTKNLSIYSFSFNISIHYILHYFS